MQEAAAETDDVRPDVRMELTSGERLGSRTQADKQSQTHKKYQSN